jgi:myosin-crossreactive antigen
LRTRLNKLKIEDWFGSRYFLAPFSFKWNCVFCSKWRRFIHCSFKKNRELKTVLFWMSTSSSSLDVLQAGEEKDYSSATSLSLSLSLSLSNINPKINKTHGLPLDEKTGGTSFTGGCPVAARPPYPCVMNRQRVE